MRAGAKDRSTDLLARPVSAMFRTSAVVLVLSLTFQSTGVSAETDGGNNSVGIYRNEWYGFGFRVIPDWTLEAEKPPRPDHGPCLRRKTSLLCVIADYNAADKSVEEAARVYVGGSAALKRSSLAGLRGVVGRYSDGGRDCVFALYRRVSDDGFFGGDIDYGFLGCSDPPDTAELSKAFEAVRAGFLLQNISGTKIDGIHRDGGP